MALGTQVMVVVVAGQTVVTWVAAGCVDRAAVTVEVVLVEAVA